MVTTDAIIILYSEVKGAFLVLVNFFHKTIGIGGKRRKKDQDQTFGNQYENT